MAQPNFGNSGLVDQVRRVNQANSPEERRAAVDALARMADRAGSIRTVMIRLVNGDHQARRIAFELALHQSLPLPDEVVSQFEPALADREMPIGLRIAVAAALVKSLSPTSPRLPGLLRSLSTGSSRSRSLDRLRQLRSRLRESRPALDALIVKMEAKVLMRCPKCSARLNRPEMVKHLWQEHRLMLDGPRVREPWNIIEDWLAEYARTADPSFLERAYELGEQLDPQSGLVRVNRMLMGNGHVHEEALGTLRNEAQQRHATLCPQCFAIVPMPEVQAIPALTIAHGRIAFHGYAVELDESGAMSYLTVSLPNVEISEGRAPESVWTWKARLVVWSGLWVLLAMIVAIELPRRMMLPILPVIVLLIAAMLGYLLARLAHRRMPSITHRAINAAWTELVPLLHREGYSRDDATFIRGLAAASIPLGSAQVRETVLEITTNKTQFAYTSGEASLADLLALRRLALADTAEMGKDPILGLAEEAGRSFRDEMPFDYAEQLLTGWEDREWWTVENRARLAVLLLRIAYDSGWEVWDLHELGHSYPIIAAAIGSAKLDRLANLRRLIDIKQEHSWQETGQATLVFELARFPVLGGQYLADRPDLLLFQPMTDGEGDRASSDPILICESGILYRGVWITDPATETRIKARPLWQGGGFELTCGPLKLMFRQEPIILAKRLQGWIHFLFRTFRPSVDVVLKTRSRDRLQQAILQRTVICPECQSRFLGRRGERGEPWMKA